jgi:quercetin dioxygenase-like cupin family protein
MVSLGMASPVQGRWSLSTGGVIGRVGALAVALGVGSVIASMPVASADTTGSASSEDSSEIRAYRLYTGADGNSHVQVGSVNSDEVITAESIMFEVTPAHSSYDWHNAPTSQYVLTLTGVLVFSTMSGETFTIVPGDVLLAEDLTGTGHAWQMVGDDPWRRAYVIFPPGVDTQFVPDLT